jgi:phytoene synthase
LANRAQEQGPTGDGDRAYCTNKVSLDDKDRYISALYAPNERRRALIALYAFHNEIAAIPDLVSEPVLGEIRLQWWRDAITGLYAGTIGDHPILRELAGAIAARNLDKSALLALLDTRAFELYEDPFADWRAFETYSDQGEGAVIYLGCRILAGESADVAADAARYAGRAAALTCRLRFYARDAQRGKRLLPRSAFEHPPSRPKEQSSGTPAPNGRIGFAEVLDRAFATLAHARDAGHLIPAAAFPAFLPVSVLDLYLNAMAKPGYDPLRHQVRVNRLRRQWRLMRCARKSIF